MVAVNEIVDSEVAEVFNTTQDKVVVMGVDRQVLGSVYRHHDGDIYTAVKMSATSVLFLG